MTENQLKLIELVKKHNRTDKCEVVSDIDVIEFLIEKVLNRRPVSIEEVNSVFSKNDVENYQFYFNPYGYDPLMVEYEGMSYIVLVKSLNTTLLEIFRQER